MLAFTKLFSSFLPAYCLFSTFFFFTFFNSFLRVSISNVKYLRYLSISWYLASTASLFALCNLSISLARVVISFAFYFSYWAFLSASCFAIILKAMMLLGRFLPPWRVLVLLFALLPALFPLIGCRIVAWLEFFSRPIWRIIARNCSGSSLLISNWKHIALSVACTFITRAIHYCTSNFYYMVLSLKKCITEVGID